MWSRRLGSRGLVVGVDGGCLVERAVAAMVSRGDGVRARVDRGNGGRADDGGAALMGGLSGLGGMAGDESGGSRVWTPSLLS
jgi:hypothetical protein